MHLGINAGFGDPLIGEFGPLATQQYTHIRQDLHHLTDPDRVRGLIAEFRAQTVLTPLYIVRADQLPYLNTGESAELLNEPNYLMTPEAYANLWDAAHEVAQMRGVHLYAGSISNLHREALAWFGTAWRAMTSKPLQVSVHRYPNDGGWSKAHPGFARREDEVVALHQIIGTTPYAVTEFGYHTARRWRWGFWPARWSEATVANFCREEWRFWYYNGATATYIYQLNDGPTSHRLDRYGVRTLDRQWKLSAASHHQTVLFQNR